MVHFPPPAGATLNTMIAPQFSVVIPTHNRRDSVTRLLRALGEQDPVPGSFEAIVVADGCVDGTVDALRALDSEFPCTVLEQPASGPGAARNSGAAHSTGDILLFLDDDVEPRTGVLRAHAAFHAEVADGIGLGYLQPAVTARGFFGAVLRGWWESMFEELRRPGHRYLYSDLLTGHFSLERRAFERLGGFDAALPSHEDYELGYRAIAAGMNMRFVPDAIAVHHEASDLSKTFRRQFDDGVADVRLLERYPALGMSLPLARRIAVGRVGRVARRLASISPRAGDRFVASAQWLLPMYERIGLRFRWRALLEDLLDYWYGRGLVHARGGRDDVAALLRSTPDSPREIELELDLAGGIGAAEKQLDERRPRSVRFFYGQHIIGTVPQRDGAERLRSIHLREMIVRRFGREYLRAAARAGAIPHSLPALPTEVLNESPARETGPERTRPAPVV
jgi:glycosyltransferase involved in cell wall biosynthesis